MERRRPFPGWYVAAVPGAEFQVCVTSIQSSFPTVLGKKLGKDRAVFADLLVDGSMADGCRTDRSRMLREVYIDGFLESLTVPRASGSIISSIRKFVFEKVDGTRMENATGEDRGAIVLYMFSAKHAAVEKKASLMSIDPSSEDADVFKKGRTFKVARTGKQIAKTYYRRASFLRDKKLEGRFLYFFGKRVGSSLAVSLTRTEMRGLRHRQWNLLLILPRNVPRKMWGKVHQRRSARVR